MLVHAAVVVAVYEQANPKYPFLLFTTVEQVEQV